MNQDSYKGDTCTRNIKEPIARRGACSFIYDGKFYLYRGDSLNYEDPYKLDVLDLNSGCWATEITLETDGTNLPLSGACCTVINDCLYVFGGFGGIRQANVHELNLSTRTWRKLSAINPEEGPILKDKAGMVAYGKHMLCVFGGYGHGHLILSQWDWPMNRQSGATYDPDGLSPIYWTNELHLFNIPTCMSHCVSVLCTVV